MSGQIKKYLDKLKNRPELQAKFALYCAKICEPKMQDERSKNALRACESGNVTLEIINDAYVATSVDNTFVAYAAACAADSAIHYAHYAAEVEFYTRAAVRNTIKVADNKKAQEEAIIQKLKQIAETKRWVE